MASVDKMYKVEVTAPLRTEAAALAAAADILSLPDESERQPDLQYLTAIFVSSGQNKNGAVFLGSELVKARNSISNKAVDIEHDEQTIIGQITGSVFLSRDRTPIDVERAAASMDTEQLDQLEMDVGISAIIHRARFPHISQEIVEGSWMVSMEAYYRDFDIKVGDMIIPREKAEEMGFDKLVGTVVQLKDGEKEMGFHLVGRVLRDILFAGVGLVKNPANPRSIIMEAAAIDEYVDEESKKGAQVVMNLAEVLTGVSEETPSEAVTREFVSEAVRAAVSEAFAEEDRRKEDAGQPLNDILPGTCVSYKRYVYQPPSDDLPEPSEDFSQYPLVSLPLPGAEGPGARIVAEHHCALFDLECSARPGDATSPVCWRNVFARTVREEIFNHEEVLRQKRIQSGFVELQNLLVKAKQVKK